MKKKTINLHLITTDKNVGYGKAGHNMAEAFKKTDNIMHVILPARQAPVADIDFFVKPPPWNIGRAKRKIAHFYWEATPLPIAWSSVINSVTEIWAPCPLVANCCKEAGFRGRLEIVPTPAISPGYLDIPSLNIPGINSNSFIFYSIFQWHNRKGWKELLAAYFEEFTSNDNVSLIIKTNPINHLLQGQISEDIKSFKLSISNQDTAPLALLQNIISEEELFALHKTGHCYVAPHHGEGWGMPIHDAIMAGKQIIATKFGGVTEFLDDNSFYPIPFSMVPVRGMDWNAAYCESQKWAQPDISELRRIMRDVYENHKKNIFKNMIGNQNIDKLSFDNVVNLINKII